jgi:hypothetical protein
MTGGSPVGDASARPCERAHSDPERSKLVPSGVSSLGYSRFGSLDGRAKVIRDAVRPEVLGRRCQLIKEAWAAMSGEMDLTGVDVYRAPTRDGRRGFGRYASFVSMSAVSPADVRAANGGGAGTVVAVEAAPHEVQSDGSRS